MNETKHTTKPWTVGNECLWHIDEATGMGYRFRPIEFDGGCLAWVSADDGDEEAEPNARLIAAAPDLLEALERYEKLNEDLCGCDLYDTDAGKLCPHCEARAAITKAIQQE